MPTDEHAQHLLRHWREAVPNDRLAHLIRDVARAQMRALQQRLGTHGVSFGHWTFLRILWIKDGLTQRELSELAGVMEPTTFSAIQAMEALGFIRALRSSVRCTVRCSPVCNATHIIDVESSCARSVLRSVKISWTGNAGSAVTSVSSGSVHDPTTSLARRTVFVVVNHDTKAL